MIKQKAVELRQMGIEDMNGRNRQNAFGEFVDKPRGNGSSRAESELHGRKKAKLHSDSEAILFSTSDQPFPIPKQLLTTLIQNSIQFQQFMTKSYSPPSTSASTPPVYILKVTSASNSNGEDEVAGNRVKGEATAVVTETRLVADDQFLLRSRL